MFQIRVILGVFGDFGCFRGGFCGFRLCYWGLGFWGFRYLGWFGVFWVLGFEVWVILGGLRV